MYLPNPWLIVTILSVNLILTMLMLVRLSKQEKFQTSEAHANLELINQSLNRLSDIAEKLEHNKPDLKTKGYEVRRVSSNGSKQSKEKQALTMIRQGENSVSISRRLGISRSEVDLLVASEKLGNNRLTQKTHM